MQKAALAYQLNLPYIKGEHDLAKFRRAMRMNSPRDFSRVFRLGQRIGGGGLTVITIENKVGYPRLGLAVAKKHLKLASQRNRLKRVIRESFRCNQSALNGIDIVVLSRADVARRNSAQIKSALERHWSTLSANNQVAQSGKNSD